MSERRGISNKKLLRTKWFYQDHSSKILNCQTYEGQEKSTQLCQQASQRLVPKSIRLCQQASHRLVPKSGQGQNILGKKLKKMSEEEKT